MSKNIYQRLAEAMKLCTYVKKDTKVTGFGGGYSAVSHDAVTAKVRQHLLAVGVIAVASVIESGETREEIHAKNGMRTVFRCSVVMETRFVNIDDPGDCIVVRSIGTGEDSGDKAPGKAVSYAVKYGLLKALMLETGDDADQDASIPRAVDPLKQRCTDFARTLGKEEEELKGVVTKLWKDIAPDWARLETLLIAIGVDAGIELGG